MREKLEQYIKECEWIARHGLFDGNGMYFGPGADAIPLMFTRERGHLSGFTFQTFDVDSMRFLLEQIGDRSSHYNKISCNVKI